MRQLMESIELHDADNFENRVREIIEEIVLEYKQYSKEGYRNEPSAPNTGSFISRSYGMIEVADDVVTHEGPGGMFSRHHPIFLKIGASVDSDIRKEIVALFKEKLDQEFGQFRKMYKEGDNRYHFNDVVGSSWGGIGYFKE